MRCKNGYLFAVVCRVMLIGILGCEIPPSDPDPIDPIDPNDPPASSMPCAARPGAIKPWEGALCNGNLQLGVSLSVIGIGLSYNSIDAMHQEGFGYGWRLSVRSRLSKDELDNITIIRSDGTPVQFDLEGSDYRAEPMTFSRLTRDAQGNFTETFKGGKRHIYQQVAGGHYLYQQIDRNGNIITINRDGLGRETNLTDPYGRTVTFSFNNDMLQAVTDHEGRTFVLGYNQAGELVSVTQPAVPAGIPVARFEYDSDGTHLVVSQITPAGQTTGFDYYDGGVLKAVIGAGGHQMLVEYTPSSVTQKYSMGEQTIQQFVDGELMALGNELGLFVYYNRDSRHRVTRITDSLGHAWELGYNDTDDLIQEKNPLDQVTIFGYDSHHNPLSVTSLGLTWGYQYDAFNQLTQATDPVGHTTQYDRDGKGNLTRVVDHTGVTRSQASYNPDGALSSITNMFGDSMSFSYDDYGNLVTVEHPDLGSIEMESTPMGILTEQITGLGGVTRLSYDSRTALTSYSYQGSSTKQGGEVLTVNLGRDLDSRVTSYMICGPAGCDSAGKEIGPSGSPSSEQVNGNNVQDGECPCVDPPAP